MGGGKYKPRGGWGREGLVGEWVGFLWVNYESQNGSNPDLVNKFEIAEKSPCRSPSDPKSWQIFKIYNFDANPTQKSSLRSVGLHKKIVDNFWTPYYW